MTKTLRISLLLLLLVVISGEALHAQGWRDKPVSSRNYVGFELGGTYSWLPGSKNFFIPFNWPYIDPFVTPATPILGALPLTNLGSGFGFQVAGTVDLAFNDYLGLQAKLFYRTNNTSASETNSKDCSANGVPGTAEIEDKYSFALAYFGLNASLRFQIIQNSLYGLLGLDYAALASHSLSGHETIVSSTNGCQYLLLPSGNQSGFTVIDIPKQSLSDFFNTSQLGVKVGAGTFIPLGDNGMVLTPEVNLTIPLSTLFTKDREAYYATPGFQTTTPTLWHLVLSVALKFPFGGSNEPEQANVAPTKEEPNAKYVNLTGKVSDATTGEPVKAKVTVVDLQNNKVVSQTKTDNDGQYDVRVKAPGRYSVTADADGYLFGSTIFSVDDQGRILKGNHDIKLANSTSGRVRLLIFFDFNKSTLQPESYPELERAVAIMKANSSMEVEIAGYTDNVGGDQYNLDLSRRRANEVRDYLVRHNIEAERITAKGYGEASPIAPNDTDDGRSENRRVEFVVLKK